MLYYRATGPLPVEDLQAAGHHPLYISGKQPCAAAPLPSRPFPGKPAPGHSGRCHNLATIDKLCGTVQWRPERCLWRHLLAPTSNKPEQTADRPWRWTPRSFGFRPSGPVLKTLRPASFGPGDIADPEV